MYYIVEIKRGPGLLPTMTLVEKGDTLIDVVRRFQLIVKNNPSLEFQILSVLAGSK